MMKTKIGVISDLHLFNKTANIERALGEDTTKKSDYSSFLDAASVSGFASDAMQWAYGMGIITGKEQGTKIDPQGNTARCEAAVIIQRFINSYE